ncbi:MAG: NADH:ubiquinone oxidoreductase [Comamonadaceae bacterium]|nr:NADH:ubiquinone oxidoreductase [Comamonadaceae bacterium]
MPDTDRSFLKGQRVALLLAKASITGAADAEMQRLADQLAATGQVAAVRHAYSEQGSPSLHDCLSGLADEGVDEIVLLPLLLPMEPGFRLWVARAIERWRGAAPLRPWPRVRIAEAPARNNGTAAWLRAWLSDSLNSPFAESPPRSPEGSVVPPQQRRVLVCQGGPCNDAGATVVWAHLRNEQKRLNLRTTGVGVMTCKTTCLGPCNLAPVLQVFPEGTYYGGVDETGIDRIVEQHLMDGCVVEELAYPPVPGRQSLRLPAEAFTTSIDTPAVAAVSETGDRSA